MDLNKSGSIIQVSTVTPVYRGEVYLSSLVAALDAIRAEWQANKSPLHLLEAIFVDDGSSDGSSEVLVSLSEQYHWVTVITLSRNFGQHPATVAGIMHSSGDWVVTLDEDLQHHPNHILKMMKMAVYHQTDIVYARPEAAVHQSWIRDAGSRYYKKFISLITRNPHVPKFNSFRLIRGDIARVAASVSIDQTYFDMALCWFTNRVDQFAAPMQDQRFVETKQSGYTLVKLLSHARRMLQSSELKISRVGVLIGFVALFLGGGIAITVLLMKIFAPYLIEIPGWASIIVLVATLGGVNALLLGLVIEHVSVLLLQSHGKPKFFIVDRRKDKTLKDWFKAKKK